MDNVGVKDGKLLFHLPFIMSIRNKHALPNEQQANRYHQYHAVPWNAERERRDGKQHVPSIKTPILLLKELDYLVQERFHLVKKKEDGLFSWSPFLTKTWPLFISSGPLSDKPTFSCWKKGPFFIVETFSAWVVALLSYNMLHLFNKRTSLPYTKKWFL